MPRRPGDGRRGRRRRARRAAAVVRVAAPSRVPDGERSEVRLRAVRARLGRGRVDRHQETVEHGRRVRAVEVRAAAAVVGALLRQRRRVGPRRGARVRVVAVHRLQLEEDVLQLVLQILDLVLLRRELLGELRLALEQPRARRVPLEDRLDRLVLVVAEAHVLELDVVRVLLDDRGDGFDAEEVRHVESPDADVVARLEQVVRDARRHDGVALVVDVFLDEAAHPLGRRDELARRALDDEIQVRAHDALRLGVAADVLEVREHERDEPRIIAFLARQDLEDRHLLDAVVVRVHRARVLAVLVRDAVRRFLGIREVRAPPERRVRGGGVPRVRRLHVLVDLGHGDVDVEVERQKHAEHEHRKHRERGVLEVRQLDFHRAQLDAPADVVRVRARRRLPADRVPVRRLDVLEVVRVRRVVEFFDHALEHDERIANEEVRDVAS
mmetsp:Transcript_5994/g.25081  ORF Transcript_5994/g.25081 Transcript_5994/m.25081 type:complete len:440 (-) Transcript_5994:1468-2787(-)